MLSKAGGACLADAVICAPGGGLMELRQLQFFRQCRQCNFVLFVVACRLVLAVLQFVGSQSVAACVNAPGPCGARLALPSTSELL